MDDPRIPAPRRRVRMSREDRFEQILEASTRLVARRGYFGLSLQDVADAVGVTQPGLLHYVGSKEGLLRLIVEQRYDRRFDPEDFVAAGAPGSRDPGGPSFPAYCRYLVASNAREPELVRLYMVLGAEASSPGHPAHAYFDTRPDAVWELYSRTPWRLPPEAGPWTGLRGLVEHVIEAMDGVQVRAFRSPRIDMVEEWARFEKLLFPSPVWDGYR
ncbi:helix-turn-helix domain containing protein [Microbacterium betulae]|uniref:Helix-turn-helix domain containing protein n=1 Tax=Microbacterium betulae TaxID=2981139 RepID=A0AA97I5J7_9MICO|nr:helix-turn-helix domain-containing protein [Microbacterium sp. AB]WOF21555.1 helix-turn-helix domain containing protein [Microbacterium sp. AB]